MIDKREFAALRELLEDQVRDAAAQRGPIDWYTRRFALQANKPERLLPENPRRRKWRIRRITFAVNVVINSSPPGSITDEGLILDDGINEREDRHPFAYKGEIWGVADAACEMSVEEWSIPDRDE